MYIRLPGGGTTLYTSGDQVVTTAPDEITFTFSGSPFVLWPITYWFVCECDSSVTWSDDTTDSPQDAAFFTLTGIYYDTTYYTTYTAPLKITAYLGTFTIINPS